MTIKHVIAVLMVLSVLPLRGQTTVVPPEVLSAFTEKYPDAEDVNWKQHKETFQAEFLDIDQTIAIFSKEGIWQKTITLISEEDLLEDVSEYIIDNYDLDDITQIHMIETNKQLITYKVILLGESGKLSLEFSEEGELLKTTTN